MNGALRQGEHMLMTNSEVVVVGIVANLLETVRAEYMEMPGLCLTMSQAARLWNIDQDTCRIVLDTLVRLRFLQRTRDGAYLRCNAL